MSKKLLIFLIILFSLISFIYFFGMEIIHWALMLIASNLSESGPLSFNYSPSYTFSIPEFIQLLLSSFEITIIVLVVIVFFLKVFTKALGKKTLKEAIAEEAVITVKRDYRVWRSFILFILLVLAAFISYHLFFKQPIKEYLFVSKTQCHIIENTPALISIPRPHMLVSYTADHQQYQKWLLTAVNNPNLYYTSDSEQPPFNLQPGRSYPCWYNSTNPELLTWKRGFPFFSLIIMTIFTILGIKLLLKCFLPPNKDNKT